MNSTRCASSVGAKLATLLGSASLLAMAHASAYAQGEQQLAQADEIPETVLITGSLIRGTAAVGVPVTNLTPMDFAQVGALTTADLFRTFPAANVSPGAPGTSAGNFVARNTRVNLRGLDTGDGTRSLLMVDGMRYPAQGQGLCMIDPSIIPALALDHIDILVDGASATYGSDAIGGVINIILKRNMDGATTQLRWSTSEGGRNRYLASAIWGRTWDGGQVTITYEWYNETPVRGGHSNFTTDFRPWGFDDRTWLGSATPGIISTGAASQLAGGNVGTSAALGHGCTNCYAIPVGAGQNWDPGTSGIGPTGPSSAATLNWSAFNNAANSGTNGLRNQFNAYDLSWFEPNQDRNAAVLTVDQRLTTNISFYGSAFYSNRRSTFVNPGAITPTANVIIQGFSVPTFNPYYPTGAPGGLRVWYHLGHEVDSMVAAHVLGQRYQMGLNIALPGGWASQVWYAESFDKTAYNTRGTVNKAAISAALGWTLPVTAASGSTPAIATWAKPANVPYLNLFCDPLAYQCNSETTLNYITATRALDERYKINEKGIKADGPLFDLPGGPVKAAVGATYTTFAFSILSLDNTNASSLILPYQVNAERRAVWAVFTQVNIPVFSDNNAIPFFRRLELEGSWRHDQYSDVGGTSNPKVAFNWSPINDFTVRGTWGSSFRAPSFGEISALANVAINGQNLLAQGLAVNPDEIRATGCGPTSLPPVGSGAWKLMSSLGPGGNGTPGSASTCPAAGAFTLPGGAVVPEIRTPPGINILGGIGAAAPVRAGGFNGGPNLIPEQAINWGIGFDYTPSANFLTGLNLQATYYQIKLNGTLRNFGQPNSSNFNDPDWGDNAVFVPTDWLNSGLPGAAACTSNVLPTTCAPFQDAVKGLLLHPRAQVSPLAQTLIMWIHDGGTVNRGWQKIDGIDFQASYDWEWGDIGAFNTGIIGTYYLHTKVQFSPGSAVVDFLHQTVGQPGITEAEGVATNPRFRYRARLGWSNGTWSVTGFVDYFSHYYHQQTAPPNVNGNFCAANGGLTAAGTGGTYPCAIDNYSNITPSHYTFDLSIGYETGDRPANEYLRNIGFQFVIQNILDKHAQFQYKPSTAGGPPSAIAAFGGPGGGASNAGRVFNLILTKQW